ELKTDEIVTTKDLARLWAARLLLNGHGYRVLDGRRCRIDDEMCQLVSLDPERAGDDRAYCRRRLKTVVRQTERRLTKWPRPLARRLDELGDRLTLNAAECEILALMTMMSLSE